MKAISVKTARATLVRALKGVFTNSAQIHAAVGNSDMSLASTVRSDMSKKVDSVDMFSWRGEGGLGCWNVPDLFQSEDELRRLWSAPDPQLPSASSSIILVKRLHDTRVWICFLRPHQ